MANIQIRFQQRYIFNYLNEDNKPEFITNSYESTLAVIWYKSDETGLELWIPFGTDNNVPKTNTETNYTVPRLISYHDQSLHLGGCLCFEPDTLWQQQIAHESIIDGKSQWFVKNPLTRSDCLYGDQDDYFSDVTRIVEYWEQGY